MLDRPFLAAVLGVMASGACGGLATSQGRTGDASADRTLAPSDAGLDVGVGMEGAAGDASCTGFSCDASDAPAVYPACPSAPPVVGSPCPDEGMVCEYGPSWWLACNMVVTCGSGGWQSSAHAGAAPCADVEAGLACPATWTEAIALDAGMLQCPAADCQYPEGYCECVSGCGGGGAKFRAGLMGSWRCMASTTDCPSPRPLLGTACAEVDAGLCNYGWPCGCGQDESCHGGVWRGYFAPPCP